MDNIKIWLPLLLAFLAGLFTLLGSLVCFLVRDLKKSYLEFSLGLSAGVMIYIAFVELLTSSIRNIGFLKANMSFFGGIILIMFLDFVIPHEYIDEHIQRTGGDKKIMKAGIFIAIGLAIHNFPEGLAVFMSSMVNIKLGISLAVAIALHNIPEGVAIAMPIFYATKSRRKAFWYSSLSGIAEPIGAIVGMLVLMPFLKSNVLSYCLAAIAGIMVFISFDELLPLSCENKKSHVTILGIILGMLMIFPRKSGHNEELVLA
ncbi:MAG: zinc transporter ZupT [Candidatus Omnitrophica bacterium]|jgi:ZIP family zinc transporter|nr:zinc transporter ZupT [Candidatus Omnitrophota bacterium]